jgi:aryl-alcohol dehydrogenase-like predicted oxidoreductase
MFDVSETVSEIAQESGHTPAQVALAWLLAQDGVTAPIVGASRPEQLDDSAGAIGFELSAEQLDRLAQVSQPFL